MTQESEFLNGHLANCQCQSEAAECRKKLRSSLARNGASLATSASKPDEMKAAGKSDHWLGRQGSNLGMAESKSAALPLGYAPIRIGL
jgi:hypothetical protein